MPERPHTGKRREGAPHLTETESVSTGSIVDSSDGQAWETLRDVGYQNGDVITFHAPVCQSENAFTTSSGSFAFNSGVAGQSVIDLSQIPTDVTLRLKMVFKTWGTMDADGDYKAVLNDLAGSPETPIKTVSSGSIFQESVTGSVEISDRGVTQFRPEIRSDGTNTISLANATPVLEIVL